MSSFFIEKPTSVVIIPELVLSSLVSTKTPHQCLEWGENAHSGVLHFKGSHNYMAGRNSAHSAPVVIYDNGLPVWPLTRYLYDRLYEKQFRTTLPFSTTGEITKAKLLSSYANWCHEEKVDLFNFDFLFDEEKPVHRFREYLLASLYDSESTLTIERASSTISAVIAFYRWCQIKGYISEHASMWDDEHKMLLLKATDGRAFTKEVISSSLSIQTPKRNKYALPDPGRVDDEGEKLRPLDDNEQQILFSALKEIDNYQYILIFMIALVTGMRKQPILTLREESIEILANQVKNGADEAALRIGGSELVNNKKNKPCTIYFPSALVTALINFKDSRLRQIRVKRAEDLGYQFTNPLHQHLFITQQGKPIYTGWDSPLRSHGEIKGAALNTLIQQNLKPRLKKLGFKQHFIFHDLRATFAHNFLVENYDPELHDRKTRNIILTNLKSRMGHNSIDTTELYLNIAEKYEVIKSANNEYLELLLGKGLLSNG